MARRSRTFKASVLASGNAATALVTLLLAAVLSRHFDKVDYATYRQTLLAYKFAAPLLTLGLPAALYYFLPVEKSRSRAILLENLMLLGVTGLAFSLFLALGGNVLIAERFSNPDLEKTLLIFALYPALFLPATAVSATLVVREKMSWLFLHTVGTRLLRLGLVLVAIWLFPGSPLAAVGATTISGVVVFASAIFLMLRAVRRGDQWRPTRRGVWLQLKYAVPLGLAAMLETLALGIDQVLVSILCSPERYAVYVNGAMEIPFLRVITAAATAVILPELVAFYKEGKKKEALGLWQRSARKVSLLLLPVGGALFVTAPELMTLLYSADYMESSRPFRIYLLLLPARLIYFGAIFQAAGRSDLILKRAVGTLVLNTVLSYPLVYYFGIEGAAWGTVLVFWLYVIPYCIRFCARLLETGWTGLMPYRYVGMLLLAITVSGAAALWMRHWFASDFFVVNLALGLGIYLCVLAPLLFVLCREDLQGYWRAIKRRAGRGRRS